MNIVIVEFILSILITFVWMGPFLFSIKNKVFNFIHPQTLIPIWLVYFVWNAMIEKWTPWMNEPDPGIIRTTENLLTIYPNIYISPLIIVLLSGIFFHLGIRILSPAIYSQSSFNARSIVNYKIIGDETKSIFLIFSFIFCSIAWLPNYILPNTGLGTFWTYPLAMTNCFLPFMVFVINKRLGILCFVFTIITGTVLQSKAALVYPVLPILFYYFYFYFYLKNVFSIFIPILLIIFIWVLLSLGGFDFVLAKLLHRDYAFEVFAALVHYSNNSFFGNLEYGITGLLNSSSISWTWAEIVEGIPSILNPYKGETINPAKLVTESFLPIDYQNSMLRNAYFNRFLLFAGYHDFGFIGAFLQSFFVGFLYSWFYRRMLRRISKEKLLWPIFVYLPVPCISTYFVTAGGITYGFINALIPAMMILMLVYVTKFLFFLRLKNIK